ncbi:hypothetical protein ACQJ0K_06145 [Priestia megaterium]|uniref:hypothetical protein n=1 Tax=Priestia megaterium TaxID=1404 RepID=UPI003CF77ECB
MNRSDLFMLMVNVDFICLGASSCEVEGKTKTPEIGEVRPRMSVSNEEAHRLPAEREVLHGNQQRCNQEIHTSAFILFVRL